MQTARRHFPHLKVLARANGRSDASELIEAGVTHVFRETLDSSLRMGVEALRLLGRRASGAQRAARTFRRHDEQTLGELALIRHGSKGYISLARRRIQDLEQVLSAELSGHDDSRDAGWDIESLRAEDGKQPVD